jgi:hypothetical protein
VNAAGAAGAPGSTGGELLSPAALGSLERRLRALHPLARRRWGTMSPAQAVEHLAESYRSRVEGRALPRRGNLLHRTLLRWLLLHTPLRWPRGRPRTPGPQAPEAGSHAAADPRFRARIEELCSLLRAFSALGPRMHRVEHPLFGRLSAREWATWAYRHADHHLRRFGL